MPVNEAVARSKAKELVQRLKSARSRGISEIDEAESALRTFAATHAASMETELVELRTRGHSDARLITSLQEELRRLRNAAAVQPVLAHRAAVAGVSTVAAVS